MSKNTNISLRDLAVLFLDIQATGPNPEKGEILEIGWCVTGEESVSRIVAPEESEEVPGQITRLTGIDFETWQTGEEEQKVWKDLQKDIEKTRKKNRGVCPAVIHYARYEKPFLKYLYNTYSENDEFPLSVICTHEMSRRLIPDLPRKSIRAVAGYFGHTINRPLSALNHVEATGFIWNHLIPLLEKAGIQTIGDLTDWLSEKQTVKKSPRSYPMDEAVLKDLPKGPGVYRMKRVNGDLLYIGKAKSLRQRVRSYFQKSTKHSEKNLEMLSQAQNLEYDIVNSALEAALLESDLIKKYSPPYNEQLKIKGRTLSFVSRDFLSSSSKPGRRYPLGPIPGPDILKTLPLLVEGLSTIDNAPLDTLHGLVFPDGRYSPPEEIFAEGFYLFCTETSEITEGIGVQDLLRYGDYLRAQWIKARAESAEDDLSEENTAADESEDAAEERKEREWTADDVADALRWGLSHSSLLLRRSKWFCMLGEAVIGWESRDSETNCNFLRFSKGKIRNTGFVPDLMNIPVPGKRKSRISIQKQFDISMYDRMNILMTELRRITSEGRNVRVRLSRGVECSSGKLEKLLLWV